jgi:hypothetical protein
MPFAMDSSHGPYLHSKISTMDPGMHADYMAVGGGVFASDITTISL